MCDRESPNYNRDPKHRATEGKIQRDDLMSRAASPRSTTLSEPSDTVTRIGGWLFRHRTSLPLPMVAALLLLPVPPLSASLTTTLLAVGILTVFLGEAIRFWAVHHIGVISRTRSERLGPLVDSGPFSLVRNPLYVGNILLWIGFAFSARLAWMAPVVLILLALEYHAIVRWEERLLETRLGGSYVAYRERVPRWIPARFTPRNITGGGAFSWRETVYSERGTLIAIVVGYVLLFVKAGYF
jgi:protein-S-isoprenylcysteine O-methyltransferase Ste14